MHRRGIVAVSAVVFLLMIFFQLNRMDVFAKFFASKNIDREAIVNLALDEELQEKREIFLMFYDPTSVYSTHGKVELEKYFQKIKRRLDCRYYGVPVDLSEYKGVIVGVDELAMVPEAILKSLSEYVEKGGHVYLTGVMSPHWIMKQAGCTSYASELQQDYGVRFYNGALIGADGFECKSTDFDSYFMPCTLADDVTVFVTTYQKKPLLWEHHYGRGKYVVFNSDNALRKEWRGIFTAGLSRLYDDFTYPIIGAKVMFIDDFPAPVPEGRLASIYNEFKMNTVNFYRNVWWPDMLSIAGANNLKYTGLTIETYNDKIKPPFIADAGENARKNLVSYGRELLKSGGEMGLHGYNHQSLAMEGYNQDELGYQVWESPEDMGQAIAEVRRYIEAVYPEYAVRSYVPPSNILSPEGRAAIRKAYPSINIFCALYNGPYEERCLYQDFARNEDGSYDIPRVSSGFEVFDDGYMAHFSVINAYGIFTHFIHPDELYYEETKEGQTWGLYRISFREFTKEIHDRYPWLRAATASDAANFMDTWYDFDYVTNYLENGDFELLTNGLAGALIVYRTTKKIDHVDGCFLTHLEHGAYLLQTKATNRILISFKKEETDKEKLEEKKLAEEKVTE